MRLHPGQQVDLSLALDHGQFFVADRDSPIEIETYDDDSQAVGLAQFSDGVAVFTESHWSTDTSLRLRLAEERPNVEPACYDHVVVAGLECPSGELRIFSPEETGAAERAVALPSERYGLLVSGNGFGHADEYGDNGSDNYEVWLWPTKQLPDRQSLKSGLPGA
jgi:hypothetical protein